MQIFALADDAITDIGANYDLFDDDGVLRIMPLQFWRQFDPASIARFCVERGLYCLPTTELIDMLRLHINGRSAIEIGAGNGAIGKALGIVATDSYQQREPKYAAHYASLRQPTVEYGAHVVPMNAAAAVAHYKPQVVIGAWVTHRYDPARHAHEGNEAGIDEHSLISQVDEYLMVGNHAVHHLKLILCDIADGTVNSHEARMWPAPVASRTLRGLNQDFLVSIRHKAKPAQN